VGREIGGGGRRDEAGVVELWRPETTRWFAPRWWWADEVDKAGAPGGALRLVGAPLRWITSRISLPSNRNINYNNSLFIPFSFLKKQELR
jgi:hypothetical protein